jgi:nucleoside phosphorylase
MRRGPGLVRVAATTAVMAGTAGAVRHRQEQKYANQAYEQQAQMQAQQPPPQAYEPLPAAPAAMSMDDKIAQLEKLSELQKAGVLTDDEFAAQKAKILAA